VARAILLFHYLREKWLFFHDENTEKIRAKDIPTRIPDAEGEDFKL
jgi:hypothetical protein